MKDGDFVHIDYTLKVKDSGIVFDTTKEDVAKNNNIYNPSVTYKPLPLIIGSNFIFKALEKEIKKMNVGEIRTIEVSSEEAFGKRRNDLIVSMPISEFKNRNIEPIVGNFVNINGMNGKIIAISGGRVTIDFNHPLAGKDLIYEIEIKDLIESKEGKVKAIVNYFTGIKESDIEVSINDKILRIITNKDLNFEVKKNIAENIRKWIENFEKIEFVSVY
jgi:FKBP-type peptidyl-prolyl cis-trans isomerase 2